MNFTPEFWLQLFVALGAAAGTYGAIRGDLATLHERTRNTQKDVEAADRRINDLTSFINERRSHGNP